MSLRGAQRRSNPQHDEEIASTELQRLATLAPARFAKQIVQV